MTVSHKGLSITVKFLTVSTPAAVGYKQKESVELFVYLTTGIWRGPSTNKQYPTPNRIYRD